MLRAVPWALQGKEGVGGLFTLRFGPVEAAAVPLGLRVRPAMSATEAPTVPHGDPGLRRRVRKRPEWSSPFPNGTQARRRAQTRVPADEPPRSTCRCRCRCIRGSQAASREPPAGPGRPPTPQQAAPGSPVSSAHRLRPSPPSSPPILSDRGTASPCWQEKWGRPPVSLTIAAVWLRPRARCGHHEPGQQEAAPVTTATPHTPLQGGPVTSQLFCPAIHSPSSFSAGGQAPSPAPPPVSPQHSPPPRECGHPTHHRPPQGQGQARRRPHRTHAPSAAWKEPASTGRAEPAHKTRKGPEAQAT